MVSLRTCAVRSGGPACRRSRCSLRTLPRRPTAGARTEAERGTQPAAARVGAESCEQALQMRLREHQANVARR